MHTPWEMPKWMEKYIPILGAGDKKYVTELMNDHTTDAWSNAPRAMMCVSVKARVEVLTHLHGEGKA